MNVNEPIFSTSLELKYYESYDLRLPSDWLQIIKASNFFIINERKTVNEIVITISLTLPNIELERPFLSEIDKLVYPKLDLIRELPEEIQLDIHSDWKIVLLDVTHDAKIRFRIVDNFDALDELVNRLKIYYVDEKKGKLVKRVIIDNIYIAVIDNAVFRVKALELVNNGKRVKCFFVDDGVCEIISKLNLREIAHEFMTLPFQAIEAQLDGLTNINDIECLHLISMYFDFKMEENFNSGYCLIAKPISLEPIIVRLYDTSKTNRDIDLNELLAKFVRHFQN